MEASGRLHIPAALPPRKEPLVPIGLCGWLGSSARLDAMVKGKIPHSCREPNSDRSACSLVSIVYFRSNITRPAMPTSS
jgi:hypothetical protein